MATLWGPHYGGTNILGDLTEVKAGGADSWTHDATNREFDNGGASNTACLMYHSSISRGITTAQAVRAVVTQDDNDANARIGVGLLYNETTKFLIGVYWRGGNTRTLYISYIDYTGAEPSETVLTSVQLGSNHSTVDGWMIEAWMDTGSVVQARITGSQTVLSTDLDVSLTAGQRSNLGTRIVPLYIYKDSGGSAPFAMSLLEIADTADHAFGDANDDFNRANSDSLGSGWQEIDGDLDIVSNAVEAGTGGLCAARRTDSGYSTDDQYARMRRPAIGSASQTDFGVILRGQAGADTYYLLSKQQGGTSNIRIGKVVSGSYTELATATFNDNGTNEFGVYGLARGSALYCYAWDNGANIQVATTDTDITGGTPGIGTNQVSNNHRLDDFEGGPITAVAAPEEKSGSDVASVKVSELARLVVSLRRPEAIPAGLTDTRRDVEVFLARLDAVGLRLTETPHILAFLTRLETAGIRVTDVAQLAALFTRSDSLSAGLSEPYHLLAELRAASVLGLGLADTARPELLLSVADAAGLALQELSDLETMVPSTVVPPVFARRRI